MKKLLLYIGLIVFCICGVKGCVSDKTTIDETTDINSPSSYENVLETTNQYNVDIHINYIESTGLNYSDDAYVYLDDEEIGVIENGSKSVFNGSLEEGKHHIHLKRKTSIRKYNTNKVEFDVSSDRSVFITAEENSISGLRITLTK